jgi:hypothetical protein
MHPPQTTCQPSRGGCADEASQRAKGSDLETRCPTGHQALDGLAKVPQVRADIGGDPPADERDTRIKDPTGRGDGQRPTTDRFGHELTGHRVASGR